MFSCETFYELNYSRVIQTKEVLGFTSGNDASATLPCNINIVENSFPLKASAFNQIFFPKSPAVAV